MSQRLHLNFDREIPNWFGELLERAKRKAKRQYRSADDIYFHCQGNITESNLIILVRNTVCAKSYDGTKGGYILYNEASKRRSRWHKLLLCDRKLFFFCRQIEHQLSLVNRDVCYSIWDTLYRCASIMRNEWHKFIKVKVYNLLLIAQILSI